MLTSIDPQRDATHIWKRSANSRVHSTTSPNTWQPRVRRESGQRTLHGRYTASYIKDEADQDATNPPPDGENIIFMTQLLLSAATGRPHDFDEEARDEDLNVIHGDTCTVRVQGGEQPPYDIDDGNDESTMSNSMAGSVYS